MTTNLPMIFPLIKNWLKPWFGTALRSSKQTYKYKTPGERNNSQERIMDSVKMQNISVTASPAGIDNQPRKGIVVSNKVEVTREDRAW
jgi:hypothetical protein